MAIGKRLRFEVLKRDGFRCRYCGASPVGALLQLDHVVPQSKGGTDDAANLVTACRDCNSGKSDVRLEESRLPTVTPAEQLQEQAEQIRAYLEVQREVDEAKLEIADYLAGAWRTHCQEDPLTTLYNRFIALAEQYPLPWLLDAITAVGQSMITGSGYSASVSRVKYFYGCLRRRRERNERGDADAHPNAQA
jgi:hypothetical protein